MDQNSGSTGSQGRGSASEDTSRAEAHVENAAQNRDALAAQARRTDETTPSEVNTTGPNTSGNQGGMNASSGGTSGGSYGGSSQGVSGTGSSSSGASQGMNATSGGSTSGMNASSGSTSGGMNASSGGSSQGMSAGSGVSGVGGGRSGSEDSSRATQHVENAAENRDALADENRRVSQTTPDGTMNASGGREGGGMSASGAGTASEDTTQAREATRNVEENRDALAEQARRNGASGEQR